YNETLRRGNGEKLPIKDSLSIHLNEMMTYKIEIKLPITKWKIQGLKNTSFPAWNAIEQEIWIDDLIEAIQLYLHIFVPIKSARYYRFYLKGTDHFTDGEFKNGYAVIELLEFIDTIKSLSNTSLIEFYMDVYEKVGFNIQLIDGGCLFVIRTRWEVTDISWDTWEVEDKIKLQLKWRNLGGINDRILRLWKCHRPWEIPLSYSIPDGKDNFEIIEEKTQLMPAKYIAQFDIDESWHNIFDESRLELYSESELDTFNASKSDKHDFYGKSNSYLHTNFQFPRENFNICYIDIKENKYITSDNNTSNSITGQSAKVNSIIDACIKKWEINWIGENKAIIDGETSKVLEGQKVTAYLLGIYRGKPAVYKADSSVSSGGNFQIMFDSYSCLTNVYQKGKLKLKNVVHWIIIRIDSTVPIYTVSILPEPSPISINLKLNKKNLQSKSHLYNQLFDAKGDKRYLDRIHEKQEINEIITPLMKYLQYIEIVSIDEKNKKNKEKGSLREYRFYNHNQCKKIINAYTVGVKELELLGDNRSNQQRIRLVLDSSTGEYFLGIFKEVKCLGCGAIVPSQEIWHREHYPNPKCKTKDGGKGLNPLYVGKLKISTFLTLDYSTIFSKIKSFYPQAAKFVMELYSSSYTDFNLPSYVWQNKDVWLDKDANKNKNNREKGYTFDWHKLVSALVNKEIELIKLIEKELQNIS
ncbi:MAG: hypothetical protein GYA02_01280, partial [Clostridiaceae bacterium]|nr:hypothetical protein [Clostridiaceae bacterium]